MEVGSATGGMYLYQKQIPTETYVNVTVDKWYGKFTHTNQSLPVSMNSAATWASLNRSEQELEKFVGEIPPMRGTLKRPLAVPSWVITLAILIGWVGLMTPGYLIKRYWVWEGRWAGCTPGMKGVIRPSRRISLAGPSPSGTPRFEEWDFDRFTEWYVTGLKQKRLEQSAGSSISSHSVAFQTALRTPLPLDSSSSGARSPEPSAAVIQSRKGPRGRSLPRVTFCRKRTAPPPYPSPGASMDDETNVT